MVQLLADRFHRPQGKSAESWPHTLPRVSKATGGAMPGVDFTRSSMPQESDDLDYVNRNVK